MVVGALILFANSQLRAQTTTVTSPIVVHQYQRDSWRAADGLPRQDVETIVQTSDGYLWLKAGQRVYRFDGVRFTTAVTPDSAKDVKNSWSVRPPFLGSVDAKGQAWVAFEGGKLLRYTDGNFVQVAPFDSLLEYGPMVPAPTPTGGLWVVFRDELYQWQAGKYSPVLLNGVVIKGVSALATDSAGVRYTGFRDGRVLRSDGQRNTWLDIPITSPMPVYRMIPAKDGALWIRYPNSIVLWKNGHAVPAFPHELTANNSVITPDNEGGIWAVVDAQRIAHLDNSGAVVGQINPDELQGASVDALYVDREGSLWVGTSQGLERFRKVPFTSYAIAGGISEHNMIGATWADPQTFWTLSPVGDVQRVRLLPSHTNSERSPVAFDSATITTINEPHSAIVSFTPAANGAVWLVGTTQLSLWSPVTGRKTVYGGLDSAGTIFQLLQAHNGDVWVMTSRGPYKKIGNAFHKFVATNSDRVPLPRYFGYGMIYEDRSGHIWIGGGLLLEIAADSIVMYSTKNGLSGEPVRAILQDRTGTLWAAAGMGALTRVRDNKATPVSLGPSHAEAYATGLVEDTLGNIWVSGDIGVQRISLRELNAVADGKVKDLSPTVFTLSDGLPSQGATGNRNAYAAPNGTLWFAFGQGMAAVDPNKLYRNEIPPPVRIEDVVADEHTFSLAKAASGLPAQTYRVEFHFTGTSLLVPSRMRFRYMLENSDNGWTEVGGLVRSATYTRLAPGPYKFRVQAANNDGVWNTVGTSLDFRVLPSWYQTWWARTGAVLIIVGIGAITALTIARVRLGQSEARIHAMMEERTRIAREVHDTLLQGFTGITLQLQGLKGKIRKAPEASEAGVEQLLETADATLLAARQAVWEMRPPDLERATLAEALGVALRRTAGERPSLNYQVTGTPRRLSPETEAAVLRIGVEAAANAVKHAKASVLDVELAFTRHDVQLSVRDDGCGFDIDPAIAASGTHFGLIGIRERAKKVGANVRISSTLGQGTTVLMLAEERSTKWFSRNI